MKYKKIGIIGLGRMGANMARRLHDCGYQVTHLYDINRQLTESLASEIKAQAADSLDQIASHCDIVLTVVTNDQAMESIFFGADNLYDHGQGVLFINCATLTPAMHKRLNDQANEVGARVLEACMASSIPQARNGELYLIIGGDPSDFDAAQPLLNDLSKSMRFVGEPGKAAEVKALVNMVMNMNTAALAEGLGLGEALGLDLKMLCDVFSQTGANSRVLETDAEDMLNRDHDCYFSAAHAAKDSGIALDLAHKKNLNLPLAQATLNQYQKLTAIGKGELDKSGVAELTFSKRQTV